MAYDLKDELIDIMYTFMVVLFSYIPYKDRADFDRREINA